MGEKFLEKIEGMFALALFDQKENFIFLARDRLGEKPLSITRKKIVLFFLLS